MEMEKGVTATKTKPSCRSKWNKVFVVTFAAHKLTKYENSSLGEVCSSLKCYTGALKKL